MSDWIKSVTNDNFFNRVGGTAAGSGSCAVATSFQVGYGWVDESGPTPVLQELTGAETSVPGSFYTGTVAGGQMERSYSGGVLFFRCVIPEGALAGAQKASAVGVFDQDGDLIAAAAFFPDWITPDDEYTVNIYLTFPTSES